LSASHSRATASNVVAVACPIFIFDGNARLRMAQNN
jgi:hypothetical protein